MSKFYIYVERYSIREKRIYFDTKEKMFIFIHTLIKKNKIVTFGNFDDWNERACPGELVVRIYIDNVSRLPVMGGGDWLDFDEWMDKRKCKITII